jgi:hypothetical protein
MYTSEEDSGLKMYKTKSRSVWHDNLLHIGLKNWHFCYLTWKVVDLGDSADLRNWVWIGKGSP